MVYEIQDNVALPSRSSGPAKDPNSFAGTLRRLDIEQSVFAPDLNTTIAGATWRVMKTRYPEEHGHKRFTARSVTENGVQGVRVWRVA